MLRLDEPVLLEPITLFHTIVSLMTTNFTNLATFLKFLKSFLSCIAHVKACMTNNQLQLMIKRKWFWLLQIRFPTVTRFHSPWTWMVLTSNMPTQFVTYVSVLILLSLSEKHISSIYRIFIWIFVKLVQYATHLTKDVPHKTIVCVCSFKTRLLQLTFGMLS